MRLSPLLLLLLAAASVAAQNSTLSRKSLNNAEWEIQNLNGSIDVSAKLPVYVLEALVAAGKVQGDPISGYNDRTFRWVAEETWIYQSEFEVSRDELNQEMIDLVLYGIDTVAEVHINDNLVAKLSNAHREYRVPVKDEVSEGSNSISITFMPAPRYAKLQAAEYPTTVPSLPYVRGFDHYNFIRKPASDFGWDWGPAFAPSGVYGGISLECYSAAYLIEASVRQEHHASGAVTLYFDAVLQAPVIGETGILEAAADDQDWMGFTEVTITAEGQNVITVEVIIPSGHDLWWPIGFGKAVLYNFTLSYIPESNTTNQDAESTLARRVGLRTVELVQDPLRDPVGSTFYFRVNGVPVFARGSNMIPIHIFHSQNNASKYRELIEDSVAANMNMLRIWGGGLYQLDAFYDIADEMGVLIWQEAMFACAQYPRDTSFLQNVMAEMKFQARRIGHHASLAIWGGNNEVEISFGWYPETRNNPNQYSVDYSILFVQTVREAVLSVDPKVNFVDSSPSKGVYSLDPYIKRWGDDNAVNAGDVHFYDYPDNCLDPSIYPRAKFVSEYGYQSYPSFSIYKRYTTLEDWSIQSNMSDYRQRHPNGNAELQSQMQMHFLVPAANATQRSLQTSLFQQWIYLTQVQQSMCYETAITNWRRLKAAPDARTMGVLYWQLNDIWAGPSWSGIDYGGHWKLLMYAARKFYNPMLISGTYNGTLADAISIYITNDQPWTVSGEAVIEIIPWAARTYNQPLMTKKISFRINPLDSQLIATQEVQRTLANSSLTVMDAIVRISASGAGNTNELGAQACIVNEKDPYAEVCIPSRAMNPASHLKLSASGAPAVTTTPGSARDSMHSYDSSSVIWLSEPKLAAVPFKPHIKIGPVKQTGSKSAIFTVSSRAVAAFVTLDTDTLEGIFSDNGFLLLPWEPVSITFTSRGEFEASILESQLSVMSLADTLLG